MIFLLAGCGRQKKIGVCFRDTDAGVTPQLMHLLADALKQEDYQVTAVGAGNDQAKQYNQISSFLEREYDLLIVEPVMTAEAQAVVNAAKLWDVPVIFLNHEPEEQVLLSWEKLCYIGCDPAQPGELQNDLAAALPECGDVNADGITACLVISGPEGHMDADLWAECCTRLKNAQCLEVAHGDWSIQSGRKIAGRWLNRRTDTPEIIFCMDDLMALGALEAVKEAESTAYVIGVGGQWQVLTQIAEGTMAGTVCPDVTALSETTVQTAVELLSGETVEKRTILDFATVTKENVQTFLQ